MFDGAGCVTEREVVADVAFCVMCCAVGVEVAAPPENKRTTLEMATAIPVTIL